MILILHDISGRLVISGLWWWWGNEHKTYLIRNYMTEVLKTLNEEKLLIG